MTTDDEPTRRRLLDAATRLISAAGWGDINAGQVAAAAGVPLEVLNQHFSSVSDLLNEAAVEATRRELRSSTAFLTSRTDAATAVHDLLAGLARTDPNNSTHIVLVESALAATRDARLRAATATVLDETRQELTQWLERVSTLPRPASTAIAITALIDGYLLHRIVDPSLLPDELMPTLQRLLPAANA